MYNKVEICGVNTAKLKVLTNDEKTELLKKMKNGDESARDELICGNLRLVLSVIQKFTGRGECSDDLFQVGCVGLIKAVDNFDVNQNVLFSTYAVPMSVLCGNKERSLNAKCTCGVLLRRSESAKPIKVQAVQGTKPEQCVRV